MKGSLRVKKEALVNSTNPEWKDLAAEWYETPEKVLRFAQDDTLP